jgi:hypothetical protein
MRLRLQLGAWLAGPVLLAGLALPCVTRAQRQNNRPPKATAPQHEHAAANKPARQDHLRAQENRPPNRAANAPRNSAPNSSRNNSAYAPQNNRNYTPPPAAPRGDAANRPPQTPQQQREMRDRAREWRQLPPQQRQEMRERARVWGQLTPQQQVHIKNDVLPKWKEMPADRRRAIKNRLGVLQNMPESARNQHLNDPNFTRGMSEEDKATLRDLSHLHVGGAPDPPTE